MMDFFDLFDDLGQNVTVPVAAGQGYFDYENGGVWVEPQTTFKVITAIVVPPQPDELQFDAGGTHVNLYKKAYTKEPLLPGSKVTVSDMDYTVMQELDYSAHASGLRAYYIKRTDRDD